MIKFTNLTANYEKTPIGLTKSPIVHWQILSDTDFIQKYFRVKIYSKCLNKEEEIFDSGMICRDDIFFNCEKVKLQSFTRYYWTVEVSNAVNGETAISEKGEFVTSALNRSSWRADFFRKFECLDVLLERKRFEIKEMVEKAYIFIAASGEKSNGYNVYINGNRVSDDLVMPGPMEYMAMRVRGYDITDYLKEKNVVNLDHLSAISVVIKIFTDKNTETIQTDDSWEAYPNKCPFVLGYENCYTPTRHHGKYELYNALEYDPKWYSPDYDFSSTAPLPISGWGPIKLRYLQTTAIASEKLAPVAVVKNDCGYIVDFGKIQSGFVCLTMHNQKNKVKIQYAERVVDNELCTSQYGNEYLPINEYIPVGKETETYSPYFMHTSFRYVQILGLDKELLANDVEGVFIHSDVDEKSGFKTDDNSLEYIYKCIQRSYKSNLIHIPTDCPGRERRGWTGDSYAVVDSQCFMYNVYNIYDRWFEDLHDNQRINGWCTVEYPDQTDPCIDLNWPMHTIIVPWTVYEHTGNIDIIRKNIECMEKYCDLLFEISDEYLFAPNLFMYGDWVATDRASADFVGAAMFYYVTCLLVQAEKELGRTALAEKYLSESEKIRGAVNKKYLVHENDTVYYDNNSQSANTLALMFDLCPSDKAESVLKSLIDDIETRNAVTVGFIANTWLFRVLSLYGKNELAYRLITDDTMEISPATMVNRLKNETLNESFTDINNSLNHAFLGGGTASWIFRCYAGIKIIKPGYKEFEIEPFFSNKTDSFNISVQTPYGELKLSWKRKDKNIFVKVVTPVSAKGVLIYDNIRHKLTQGINELVFDSKI